MSIPPDLLDRLKDLSQSERAEVAHHLLVGLDDDGEADPGHDEAWAAEIEDRLQAIDEGRMEILSWEEVRERLRRRLDNPRGQEP